MDPVILTTADMTVQYLVTYKILGTGEVKYQPVTVGADASGRYTDFEDIRKIVVFGSGIPVEHIMIVHVTLLDEM